MVIGSAAKTAIYLLASIALLNILHLTTIDVASFFNDAGMYN